MTDPPTCTCFEKGRARWKEVNFHTETQDTDCDGWKRLSDLVEDAAHDGREEFAPFRGMKREETTQVVTLPSSISKLQAVKRLNLYGSCLVRIPPEIGEMAGLVEFVPYTSWRLHWFPYEITRCPNLKESTVSTRKLYGNFRYRPPFPSLPVASDDLEAIVDGRHHSINCSVCSKPCSPPKLRQVWISLWVATDVVPLLVSACSKECIDALPPPPRGYVHGPHTGGVKLIQPKAEC